MLKKKGSDQSSRINQFQMIKTGSMTTQKYQYKYQHYEDHFVGEDHFPNLFLIDTHEYVTRLANLKSTFGISFDITNFCESNYSTTFHLFRNIYYSNDTSALTICNQLSLTERNGHQMIIKRHVPNYGDSHLFLREMMSHVEKYKDDKVIQN